VLITTIFVDLKIVWTVVKKHLKELKSKIEKILKELDMFHELQNL